MLKHLLALIIFLAPAISWAAAENVSDPIATEADTAYTFYIEIEGYQSGTANHNAMTVKFNFGRVLQSALKLSTEEKKALSEMGSFNTLIDAMNYLATRGWKLTTVLPTETARGGVVHRWVVSKTVLHVNDLLDGLLSK